MSSYRFSEIETKWQNKWRAERVFHTPQDFTRKKFFGLVEFPYPSGDGLHVGHPRSYTAMDVIARKRRMEGYNVLFPMGFDSFGLPTENAAIKTGIHPRLVTAKNIDRFRGQLQRLGFSFDWDREVTTSEPDYYRWTQWIFLKLFKKGLAYKDRMPVNWCTSCQVGLANEEVVEGCCERCGASVVKRVRSQWMVRITRYAERLIADLEKVNYLDKIKAQQLNWIGRSEGMEILFPLQGLSDSLKVYTTRPDTLYGVTYMVIAPDHPLMETLRPNILNWTEVNHYIEETRKKSDLERTELTKVKTGAILQGIVALNPANGRETPVFIADYVLATYGTGAIMAVPGHDQRDWEFARAHHLPILEVIAGGNIEKEAFADTENGILVNSPLINGLDVPAAQRTIGEWLQRQGSGHPRVNYKLRDWVFSRQRYWGEPIPIINCEKCGHVPLKESDLPLLLPAIEDFKPGPNGESPIAKASDWVSVPCPTCGGPAQRETDTMPQWAGSSWYFLRYCDPTNGTAFASPESLNYWMPVDWYNGGMEHTTLHLLYSRFWHKFLFDENVVPCPEPYAKRTSHGMILGEDNNKMSKSRGNVVNPDSVVAEHGADTLRCFEMFVGAFDQTIPWSNQGVNGLHKFLHRVWALHEKIDSQTVPTADDDFNLHQTIKKVSERIETMKFNTAISELMTLSNYYGDKNSIPQSHFLDFLKLLAPFAPHFCEELWEKTGQTGFISLAPWPVADDRKMTAQSFTLAIQVNGKLRETLSIPVDADQTAIARVVRDNPVVAKYLEGKRVVKEIYVPRKIYNLVVQ